MTPEQERHLQGIKDEFIRLVDEKYRRGSAEHGGTLMEKSGAWLLDEAISEALDIVVYLLTKRKLLEGNVALEPRVTAAQSLCIRCSRAGECPIYPTCDPVLECKEFVA